MDNVGELFVSAIAKEGSAAIEKFNQGMRTWVETELIDKSILRKVLMVSHERPVPVPGGLGYPFGKLAPNVDGVMVTGEFPSIKPSIVRQSVVPAVLIKVLNGHVADMDELRAVTDMGVWIRGKVTDEIGFRENQLLMTALVAAHGSPQSITTASGSFEPSAVPIIKNLISTNDLKAATIIIKESDYNNISSWDNVKASDQKLDKIWDKGELAVTEFAGLNIIPLQDRVFTKAGSTADGYVLAQKEFLGFLLEGTPLSVVAEKEKNLTYLFHAGQSLGLAIMNTNAVRGFTMTK